MSTYSHRIFYGPVPAGIATVYTNATTDAVVLRDIEVVNAATSTLPFALYVTPSGGSTTQVLNNQVTNGQHIQITGRIVLEVGDSVQVASTGTGLTVYCSGYIFK